VCVLKVKCRTCKGKLKTNLQYEIVSETDYSCVPELAGKTGKLQGKKSLEGMSVPVPTVYKEELSDIYVKWCY
jgi:hypothetical protein